MLAADEPMTDGDYKDNRVLLKNSPAKAESLLHSLEQAAGSIGLCMNANKNEFMSFCREGAIFTLSNRPLKSIDQFTYLGSNISSNESDVITWLAKAWTAIDWLSIIWKSDCSNKIKQGFFQTVAVSVLLYGCTSSTQTKCIEKNLDGNYTRMLRAVLNKSRKQHPQNSNCTATYLPSHKPSK